MAHVDEYNVNYSSPQAAGTIILQLNARQYVRIENERSSSVFGVNSEGYFRSWFTGFLLYATE